MKVGTWGDGGVGVREVRWLDERVLVKGWQFVGRGWGGRLVGLGMVVVYGGSVVGWGLG